MDPDGVRNYRIIRELKIEPWTQSLDANFTVFLIDGAIWESKLRASPLRGFTSDDSMPDEIRRTAQQKITHLELMLGQIANFCPVLARNIIVKKATCINDI